MSRLIINYRSYRRQSYRRQGYRRQGYRQGYRRQGYRRQGHLTSLIIQRRHHSKMNQTPNYLYQSSLIHRKSFGFSYHCLLIIIFFYSLIFLVL